MINGTSLRSGLVTHLKTILKKTPVFLVDLGKALVTLFTVQQIPSNLKSSSCLIDRGHIKVPLNKF